MSLAVTVDPGSPVAVDRPTLVVGSLMAGALVLSAWEQWQDGFAWQHWGMSLLAAFACAAWCLALLRSSRGGRRWSLVVAPDGRVRLEDPATGESVDAAVVALWSLGRLIYVRVGPICKVARARSGADAGQSDRAAVAAAVPVLRAADCRFLLARQALGDAAWHGLRRWLVWYRRSAHGESGAV